MPFSAPCRTEHCGFNSALKAQLGGSTGRQFASTGISLGAPYVLGSYLQLHPFTGYFPMHADPALSWCGWREQKPVFSLPPLRCLAQSLCYSACRDCHCTWPLPEPRGTCAGGEAPCALIPTPHQCKVQVLNGGGYKPAPFPSSVPREDKMVIILLPPHQARGVAVISTADRHRRD